MKICRKLFAYFKESLVDIALLFGLMLSVWAIMAKYFGVCTISSKLDITTINSLNNIFVSLAFSYIAGWIIYVMTIKIPYWQKIKSIKIGIQYRIFDISVLLKNMVEFADKSNVIDDEISDCEVLRTCLSNADWNAIDVVSGLDKPFKETLYDECEHLKREINMLLVIYKDFLSTRQIEVLETIQTIDLSEQFSIYNHMKPIDNEEEFKKRIIDDFVRVVQLFKSIQIPKKTYLRLTGVNNLTVHFIHDEEKNVHHALFY